MKIKVGDYIEYNNNNNYLLGKITRLENNGNYITYHYIPLKEKNTESWGNCFDKNSLVHKELKKIDGTLYESKLGKILWN